MNVRQIILLLSAFLGLGQELAGQQFVPAGPAAPYTSSNVPGQPMVVSGPQPYLQPSPMVFQPTPQGLPVYPPQSTVVPLPSQTPGSIFGPPAGPPAVPPGAVVTVPQPIGASEQLPLPPGVGPVVVGPGMPPAIAAPDPANPISVPVIDDDLAWDQIADVVSDFFTIAREQRVRRGGEGWCEGRIETVPLDGATVLEPHRRDSVGSFNRWESTFQSIRRRATVRAMPDANGYLVEVIVEKELEDLPRPERATAGAASFLNETSLPSARLEEVSRTRQSPRWIPLGRDPALEQLMLAEIHARLNGITGTRMPAFHP
jgi:hypothetical protein